MNKAPRVPNSEIAARKLLSLANELRADQKIDVEELRTRANHLRRQTSDDANVPKLVRERFAIEADVLDALANRMNRLSELEVGPKGLRLEAQIIRYISGMIGPDDAFAAATTSTL